MRAFAVLLFFAGWPVSAADLPRETILLQRARNIMAGNLKRLPNYTCTQTIERSERAGLNKKARLIDVVRIEVALVNGKELFAWPGSGRFVDTEISDMVQGGAIGTGNFALHAKAVFQTSVPRFVWAGEVQWKGRPAYKWDFVVPQRQSGYMLRVSGVEAVVGYHGSFWADKQTLDLLRLEVEADDVPPHLGLDTAADAVEYGRTDIAGESFLLPTISELQMTALNGSSNENRTRFTGCRQYSGESRLLFEEEPVADSQPSPGPATTLVAPPKLTVDFALHAPVVLREAAVGDPVTGTLSKALRLPDGVLIPKGALVHGRIVSLREQQLGRQSGYAVGLKFFELESGNTRVKFSGTLESVLTAQPGIRTRSSFGFGIGSALANESLVGSVFFVQSNIPKLERGLRMTWRTTEMQAEDNQ